MSTKPFQPVFKPTMTAPAAAPYGNREAILKESFTLPTLLALGALIQTATIGLLPARYSLIPLGLLLGRAAISTLLALRSPNRHYPPAADVVPGRVTAQFPETAHHFGTTAAAHPVLAFHLGMHINHPLGLLAPGGKEIGMHFQSMLTELQARREEYDALTFTQWRGGSHSGRISILLIGYFRSAEGLNKFAHGEVHRAGWDWYNRFVRETGYRHLGIYHESFLARKGDWETIYADCEPTLLGEAVVNVKEEEEKGEGKCKWVRTLVSADHPNLRTQVKRLPVALGEAGIGEA